MLHLKLAGPVYGLWFLSFFEFALIFFSKKVLVMRPVYCSSF